MHRATRFLMAAALTAGGASVATAQSAQAPAPPLPGTGNSATISSSNRENNAEYNRLIGAGDDKPKKDDRAQARKAPVPATAADIKAGASLRDIKGVPIGTIASVDANQAIVDTGQTKIGVPLMAFGKDDRGLLLGMTADKFNQLVAQAHAKSQASN
jgi:hypothetical protein